MLWVRVSTLVCSSAASSIWERTEKMPRDLVMDRQNADSLSSVLSGFDDKDCGYSLFITLLRVVRRSAPQKSAQQIDDDITLELGRIQGLRTWLEEYWAGKQDVTLGQFSVAVAAKADDIGTDQSYLAEYLTQIAHYKSAGREPVHHVTMRMALNILLLHLGGIRAALHDGVVKVSEHD